MDSVTEKIETADRTESGGKMTDSSRAAGLAAVAYLLSYPQGSVWWEGLSDLQTEIDEEMTMLPVTVALTSAIDEFLRSNLADLQRAYVETFDFSEKRTLYLTAHELGDSRKRGSALIECKQVLQQAGYEELQNELPDYLPLLLEFLSVKDDSQEVASLEARMAWACEQVRTALPEASVYQQVLRAALYLLPGILTEPGDHAREEADLAELPYPLHYD